MKYNVSFGEVGDENTDSLDLALTIAKSASSPSNRGSALLFAQIYHKEFVICFKKSSIANKDVNRAIELLRELYGRIHGNLTVPTLSQKTKPREIEKETSDVTELMCDAIALREFLLEQWFS